MKYRLFTAVVVATIALSSCGSRGNDAPDTTAPTSTTTEVTTTTEATTTTTTLPPLEGSFDAQRLLCTEEDGKSFDDIVALLDPLPQAGALIADFAPQLTELFAQDPGHNVYVYIVGVSAEDSCLQVFASFMPPPPAPSSGNRHGNGGGSGGSGNGGDGTTQTTVGGANCSGGTIDPDGDGPRGCEPTVPVTFPPVATNPPGPPPSVVVPNPDPTDTSPPSTAVCEIIDGVPSPACAFT